MTVRLDNHGQDIAYLLLIGSPLAMDNMGGEYPSTGQIAGIAKCPINPNTMLCIQPGSGSTVSLQDFTRVDPDRSIFVNLSFNANNRASGPLVSVSLDFYARFVADEGRDSTLSDTAKYKQFQRISGGFSSMLVTDSD
jgi:hypothetical protein